MATQLENPPPFEGGGASQSPAEVGAPLQEADRSRIPTLGMHLLKSGKGDESQPPCERKPPEAAEN